MSPTSLLPIVPILGLALMAMYAVGRIVKIPHEKGYNVAIDSLRGYLAFFVFLHHSCIGASICVIIYGVFHLHEFMLIFGRQAWHCSL
jgi:hypothetical protein